MVSKVTLVTEHCPICGGVAGSPHHITPVSAGGTDDSRNIVSLCKRCHDIVEEVYNETGMQFCSSLIRLIRLRYDLSPNVEIVAKVGMAGSKEERRQHTLSPVSELETSGYLGVIKALRNLLEIPYETTCVRCGKKFLPENYHTVLCKQCLRKPPPRNGIVAYNRRYWDRRSLW